MRKKDATTTIFGVNEAKKLDNLNPTSPEQTPAEQSAEQALQQVLEDAQSAPQTYLEETRVPGGGE